MNAYEQEILTLVKNSGDSITRYALSQLANILQNRDYNLATTVKEQAEEISILRDKIKELEAQVYGGSTQ